MADDARVKRIPFATFRPTFDEVCRVQSELSSVRFGPLAAAAASPSDKAASKTPKQKKKQQDASVKELTAEVPAQVQEPEPVIPEIIQVVTSGNTTELSELLKRESGVDVNEVDSKFMTALHHAAGADAVATVALLLENGANPSLLDLHTRPPYFLCSAKETRNAFRRFMAENPDAWDYTASQIPNGLTTEMEQKKKEKEAEKRRRARERKKQQKKEAEEEQRLEQEREAERERQILAGMSCDSYGKYAGKSPLMRLEYKYCSSDCVTEHRRKLMSEAALRRFGG